MVSSGPLDAVEKNRPFKCFSEEASMFGKKACMMGGMLVIMCGLAFSQPSGSSSDETRPSFTFTENVRLAIAWGEQLKPPAQYPRALINLKEALVKYLNAPVVLDNQFRLGSTDLMKLSVAFITTDEQFELTETEKKNLREYIKNGGMVVVDNAAANIPNSQAGAALKKLVKDITGAGRLQSIPNTHPIYTTPFKLGGPPQGADTALTKIGERMLPEGRLYESKVIVDEARTLEGVFVNGRLTVLYSPKGYTAKWNSIENDAQLKFGVNIVVYAITQKSSGTQKE
jgi:hypothetical protein